MKIGLLNMPLDNNYGGNLQRYALMTVLQRMGHEVTHLDFQHYPLPFVSGWPRRRIAIRRFLSTLRHQHRLKFSLMEDWQKKCFKDIKFVLPFYNRYIKHTRPIRLVKDFGKYVNKFDAFIVGSDQVWRKRDMMEHYHSLMFFDFLPPEKKRFAYGVSFGIEEKEDFEPEYNAKLSNLYGRFSAVSVREFSGIRLIHEYGWKGVEPEKVLDPTLLLDKADYQKLIGDGKTVASPGDMFCYILDMNDEKRKRIDDLAKEHGLTPFSVTLDDHLSVEQWLRSFEDAKMVAADSYHGVLFSIIFNKPFVLFRNARRGNARFNDILGMLSLADDSEQVDWDKVNSIVERERQRSLNFLNDNIKQ